MVKRRRRAECGRGRCATQVVRHYHGHLSGVYSLSLHPTLDLLVTGGRDSVARVWDVRTKQNVHTLTGHTATVVGLETQALEPQVTPPCSRANPTRGLFMRGCTGPYTGASRALLRHVDLESPPP